MAYKNLRHFIQVLEDAGELVRIKTFADPRLEIAEIADRVSKSPGGGKALLFENTGYDFPLLINSLGSERRMCLALGVSRLDDVGAAIEGLFQRLSQPKEHLLDKLAMLPTLSQFASWMPRVLRGRGACQEVVLAEPDLRRLPVMQCWPLDGGPFITLPVIHTKDPVTGIRNVGMYRMQVFTGDMTGMHWHKHKVSARHFNEYRRLKRRMPVAVSLGGDPVYTYAATAPLPDGVDEYMLAGFLRHKRVELVRCLTQPALEVPADADFVIEGYVDPDEEPVWEGPFGDHTGYYSLPDWYPRFHVTAITHRRDAVYPSTIVGIPPQEDAWIGKATERIFLAPMRMTMVPEVIDMDMPVEGVFHNLVIVQIKKDYPGQAQKVMNALWGAGQMMFNKILVIVDEEAPMGDYRALARYVLDHLDPVCDVYFSQGPMDVLDHAAPQLGFGGKMCLDGTRKMPEELAARPGPAAAPGGAPDEARLRRAFPEIRSLRTELLAEGIPVLLLAVEKNRPGHLGELHKALAAGRELQGTKIVLYLDPEVDLSDAGSALWRFCNNLDPRRDHFWADRCLGLDGSRKTAALDGFRRDWPNIIVADEATICKVNEKWDQYGLGAFLPSPSLRHRSQLYGNEAAAG